MVVREGVVLWTGDILSLAQTKHLKGSFRQEEKIGPFADDLGRAVEGALISDE